MATPRTNIVSCERCGTKNRVPASAPGTPKCGTCGSVLRWITEAGDDDFEEVALASPLPVLVDLWAEWCGPCRAVSPALEQLAKGMAGELKLVKVDVDKAPALARRFEVQGIPTLIDRGQLVSRQAGAAPAHVLKQWVDGVLAGRAS